MTTYKTLCAELIDLFEKYNDESNMGGIRSDLESDPNNVIQRAKAKLANRKTAVDS